MQGWNIVDVIGHHRTKQGQLVVLIQIQEGQQRGLTLDEEQQEKLSQLLQAQIALSQGRQLSFEIPQELVGHRPVQAPTVETTLPGTFLCQFRDDSGAVITLVLNHGEAALWRDQLTRHLDAYVQTHGH